MRRTKGQGSIVADETESETESERPLLTLMAFPKHVAVVVERTMMLCYVTVSLLSLSLSLFHCLCFTVSVSLGSGV